MAGKQKVGKRKTKRATPNDFILDGFFGATSTHFPMTRGSDAVVMKLPLMGMCQQYARVALIGPGMSCPTTTQ